MGKMNIRQYKSQIGNGGKGDMGKCIAAKALCEEALGIMRALSEHGMVAHTLTILDSVHAYLEMFDETRSTLKQAFDLTRCCGGEESSEVALCHCHQVVVKMNTPHMRVRLDTLDNQELMLKPGRVFRMSQSCGCGVSTDF